MGDRHVATRTRSPREPKAKAAFQRITTFTSNDHSTPLSVRVRLRAGSQPQKKRHFFFATEMWSRVELEGCGSNKLRSRALDLRDALGLTENTAPLPATAAGLVEWILTNQCKPSEVIGGVHAWRGSGKHASAYDSGGLCRGEPVQAVRGDGQCARGARTAVHRARSKRRNPPGAFRTACTALSCDGSSSCTRARRARGPRWACTLERKCPCPLSTLTPSRPHSLTRIMYSLAHASAKRGTPAHAVRP